MLGYRPDKVDDTSGRSTARFMFDLVKPALDEVHNHYDHGQDQQDVDE